MIDYSSLMKSIESRKSIRGYGPGEISEDILNKIKEFIKVIPCISTKKVTLKMINSSLLSRHLLNPLGSFLLNAPYFLAVIAEEDDSFLEESGFQSEYLVLYLTALGLGTCYIGLFINLLTLAQELEVPKGKRLVIVSPIGFAQVDFISLMTNTILKSGLALTTGTKRKEVEEFTFYKEWGNSSRDYLNDNPLLKQIFSFVRLSPSGANIQPWRFILSDEKIYCFAHDISKENPLLNENLWGMDFSRFDAGIAMCHFDIAAKGLGYKGGWQIPSGDNDKKEQGNSKSGNRLVGIWE